MMLTTKQLSSSLKMTRFSTYRLATLLQLVKSKSKNKILYHIPDNHPLALSLKLIENEQTKPIYTISELAALWQWRKGLYSRRRVKQLLENYDVPIHNQANKGFVYLVDLKKLLK